HIKYAGTDSTLPVIFDHSTPIQQRFEHTHQQQFGFVDPDRVVILASISVEATAPPSDERNKWTPAPVQTAAAERARVALRAAGAIRETPVFERNRLGVAFEVDGPALVLEQGATTFIDIGWRGRMTERGDFILTRAKRIERRAIGTHADPI